MRAFLPLIVVASLGCSSNGDSPTNNASDKDVGTVAPDVQRPEADVPERRFGPRRVPGRWLAGDFHVHSTGASNDTGPESTPERIKEVAILRGLDFVVLTDHSNSTGSDPTTRDEDPTLFNRGPEFPYWERAAELSDENFLLVDGNEISPVKQPEVEPTGHIGCYPRSLATFNPDITFFDRPRNELASADIIPQARAAGCFVTVNHPFVVTSWMAFDWTTRDYDGLEVFNGAAGWDQFDYFAVQGWACDESQGKPVTALGGSDNHRVEVLPPGTGSDPPLGWPTTWVWSGALEWPGIISSLDRGHVTVSDTGDPLEIDAYNAAGSWLGFAGSDVAANEATTFRLRGALHNSKDEPRVAQIVRVRKGSCDDRRESFEITPPEVEFEVLAEVEVEPDSSFDIDVDAHADPGDIVFGWLHPGRSNVIGLHGVAVTNAVRLR